MFVCPLDNINPNRVFPGRADGTFSEVLAYHFFQEIFSHVDYLIDLHGGDMVEDLIPFTIFQETGQAEVDQRSEALAQFWLAISSPTTTCRRTDQRYDLCCSSRTRDSSDHC